MFGEICTGGEGLTFQKEHGLNEMMDDWLPVEVERFELSHKFPKGPRGCDELVSDERHPLASMPDPILIEPVVLRGTIDIQLVAPSYPRRREDLPELRVGRYAIACIPQEILGVENPPLHQQGPDLRLHVKTFVF